MVMMTSSLRGWIYKVLSQGLSDPKALRPIQFRLSSALSQIPEVQLELASPDPNLDTAAILANPAFLGMKQGVTISGSPTRGVQTLKIHGIFSSFELCERDRDWVHYRAVLVPRLWRLSLNVRTQIFMEQTVPEIVEAILKEAGFTGDDYEFQTDSRSYAKREFVVQYQESDLDFISRWLEHEGIFYYFVYDDEREKVVFGDSVKGYAPIPGDTTVNYKTLKDPGVAGSKGEWYKPEIVHTFTFRHQLIPKEVVLRDYNYRSPSVDLKVSKSVGGSFGTVYEYGAHYKDSGEGEVLAQIRAEELQCRERIFTGTGDCKSFRPGHTFTLTDYFRSDLNLTYLVTEVRATGGQGISLDRTTAPVATYQNEFVCIPADVVYRPPRRTPKPKAVGTINGKVDAAGDGQYAEIDSEGRYKIQVPFDLSGKGSGTASRYMRKTEPYSGSGMGMHFPLHKGTEVVLGFTNGDPDRPIIVGAVPNAETVGPVTGGNQTQCKIHTGGGSELRIEDTDGAQYVHLSTPTENTYISLGADHHSEHAPAGVTVNSLSGISVNAGQGIALTAGSTGGHDNSMTALQETGSNVHSTAATVAATAALLCGFAADAATASVTTLASLAGDLAGFAGGLSQPGIYLDAPGKIAVVGKSEVVIGALGSADIIALGPANILSVAGAMIAAVMEAGIVAGGNIEMVSGMGDIKAHAKSKSIHLEAQKDIEASAFENMKLETLSGELHVSICEKILVESDTKEIEVLAWEKLHLESKNGKKVEIKAGNSKITLENERLTIQADEIVLETKDGAAVWNMKNGGDAALGCDGNVDFSVKGNWTADTDGDVTLIPDGKLYFTAPQVVYKTDKLDESGAKAISRANSKEG